MMLVVFEDQTVQGWRKISSEGHLTAGTGTGTGPTGPTYCKWHWVSDHALIYPVQLFGWLMTEQETRSLAIPALAAARPPVSP